MNSDEIFIFTGMPKDQVKCEVTTTNGLSMILEGDLNTVSPKVSGSKVLAQNPSLISNAWACAKYTKMSRSTRSPERKKKYEKAEQEYYKVAQYIASLMDWKTGIVKQGWCSSCINFTQHNEIFRGWLEAKTFLCNTCGSPTTPCVGPNCKNFAVQLAKSIKLPRICAEHRHQVPGFAKSKKTVKSLEGYKKLMGFEQPNLWKWTLGLTIAIPSAIVTFLTWGAAAPAIGGIIGSFAGLYGAAATSYGLALLGGGAIAAGGFGMVGGTLVISALGAALGSGMGNRIATAYYNEDKSFEIVKVRKGTGPPIIFINGFLTEGNDKWSGWEKIIGTKYPSNPIYQVFWGSKELKKVLASTSGQILKRGVAVAAKGAASTATKGGAGFIDPIFLTQLAPSVFANPWHVAKNRADRTASLLAHLLARTSETDYIIVGHSLGARVAATTTEILSTKVDAPKIIEVHLLGAAISERGHWDQLSNGVVGNVFNYHSTNDQVLKYLYRIAQLQANPVGLKGFRSTRNNIVDVDVSKDVKSHFEYLNKVKFR
jgi:hypothetical protein